MVLTTKHFGELEIEESKVIHFEDGLPGFPEAKRFILIENEEDHEDNKTHEAGLIWWLQSVDDADVAFVLLNVFAVMPEYNPLINAEEIECLGEYIEENFLVYNIAVIPEDITKLSVNLMAPVIINTVNLKGKQVIVNNEDYPIRFHIFEELNKTRK